MTSEKLAGAILVTTGVLSIALMSIHPTGDASDMMIRGVHGSLMAVILVQAAALFWTLGAKGLRDLNAAVFYGAGTIATMGAGTLNGFLLPAMRANGGGDIGHEIFDLIWWTNQSLAELGVLGVGLGFVIWSAGIWNKGDRALAGFGWIAGLAPGALLVSGHLGMDLHGALAVYGIQALWVIALGWTYWRRG